MKGPLKELTYLRERNLHERMGILAKRLDNLLGEDEYTIEKDGSVVYPASIKLDELKRQEFEKAEKELKEIYQALQ